MTEQSKKSDLWEVFFPLDASHKLATEPSFHALLAFAGAMNVVRFAIENLAVDIDDKVPAHRRRLAGSIFTVGGMLNEIRIAGNRLGQWYRDVPEYAELAEVWRGDPLASPPLNKLTRLRNTGVAHFDPEPFREALTRDPTNTEFRWAAGRGPHAGEFYYEFADEALLSYLLDFPGSPEQFEATGKSLLDELSGLLISVHQSGARLIAAVTRQLGAEVRRI